MSERKTLGALDLSNMFRMHFHATEHESVGEAHRRTVNAVPALLSGYDHVAIAIDRPPYNRRKVFEKYKANRDKAPAMLTEQLDKTIAVLAAEGYPILGSDGYEADDVLATLAEWAEGEGLVPTIYSSDKDLLQCVTDRTVAISLATGQKFGPDEVEAKFGVRPEKMVDLLALIGDKSDNIPGVAGVGPKTAAKWLAEYEDVEAVVDAARAGMLEPARFREAIAEGGTMLLKWRHLIKLMPVPDLDTAAVLKPITRKQTKQKEIDMPPGDDPQQTLVPPAYDAQEPEQEVLPPLEDKTEPKVIGETAPANAKLMAAPTPDVPWEHRLEPTNMHQAIWLATKMFESRMFGSWPNPEAILSVVMTGRSYGIDAVASLRNFHNIKGKLGQSAALIIGLCKKAPMCEYFRFVAGDEKSATWETHRRDEPESTRMTYTIEEAKLAGLVGRDNWKMRPQTMLRWRAGVELARIVYPDVVAGLYTPDELREVE